MKAKILIPMMAFVFAIGMSFATESSTAEAVTGIQTAYYLDPFMGVQSVEIGDECTPNGDIECKYEGFQLYAEESLSTPLLRTE